MSHSNTRSGQKWSDKDVQYLIRSVEVKDRPYADIAKALHRSEKACKAKYRDLELRRAQEQEDSSDHEPSDVSVPVQVHRSNNHRHRYPTRSRSRRSTARKQVQHVQQQQQQQRPRPHPPAPQPQHSHDEQKQPEGKSQQQQQQPGIVAAAPRRRIVAAAQSESSAAVPIAKSPAKRRPAQKGRQKLKNRVQTRVVPQENSSKRFKRRISSSESESDAMSSPSPPPPPPPNIEQDTAINEDENGEQAENDSDDGAFPSVQKHSASAVKAEFSRVSMDGVSDRRIHWKPCSLEEVLTWVSLCVPEFAAYVDRVRPHLDDDEVTNVEALKCLDCNDWKQYGIKPILVRKKILKAVKYL